MNIFVLDEDPREAAQMQCDKHVVKMVLETAQILSTVNGGPYKPTHQRHPCVLWAAQARDNYAWLVEHGLALAQEYAERYRKVHKSTAVIRQLEQPRTTLPTGSTPFVQCMPEGFRGEDPVEAYRKYYHSKEFAAWNRGREAPWWYGLPPFQGEVHHA